MQIPWQLGSTWAPAAVLLASGCNTLGAGTYPVQDHDFATP